MSIHLMLAIVTHEDMELEQLDVKMIFLHGDSEEIIYILKSLSRNEFDMMNLGVVKKIFDMKIYRNQELGHLCVVYIYYDSQSAICLLWAPITLTSNPTYIALNVFGLTLVAKLKEEKFIQRSGLNYTIVRPGGLRDDSPSGNLDTLFQGSILRDQVAEFAVGALLCSESSFKVVEIVARR
ncbi:unnamed protein product [Spirodela intermedia]|uniref:NAD(P)-binding domain-containing protein n=1 Tax=Spirodela intermedia TaxID=51605 RepID=A0A7I8KTG7_SPIIN|nr:unnamed protein product [Spirodela intermedia]